MKRWLRDALPGSLQVPVKYWINKALDGLEAEMELLDLLIKPGDIAIDIGGNRGIYAYRLWKIGASVIVFEPNPACVYVLDAWAKDNASVHVNGIALSDRSGAADLHIPIDDAGVEHDASASLGHGGFAKDRAELVLLRTLDSYRLDNIRLIKIDVEGHEYNVLNGASNTLRKCQPALIVEIEQRHNKGQISETFGLLIDLGYQGFFLDSGYLKSIDEFDAKRDQAMENLHSRSGKYVNNFLFLHADRLKRNEYYDLLANVSAR